MPKVKKKFKYDKDIMFRAVLANQDKLDDALNRFIERESFKSFEIACAIPLPNVGAVVIVFACEMNE